MANTARIDTARGHSYKLDGQKAPGVTTILGDGIPKPALVGWAAKTIAEYVADRLTVEGDKISAEQLVNDLRDVGAESRYNKWPNNGTFSRLAFAETLKGVHWLDRDQAANKGTAVHNYAEALMNGQEVDPPETLVGHVDAYIAWVEQWQPKDSILEFCGGNRHYGYMGTGDIITTLADGRRWLIDYKTNRSGPFQEVALQLAAYRHFEFLLDGDNEVEMPDVDCCGVLWIRADGADLYEVKADAETFRTFLYAQQVGRFCKADKSDYISDALQLEAVKCHD